MGGKKLKSRRDPTSLEDAWAEAIIAWAVCASIHREYAKGKDPFFKTRQGDFVRHEKDARAALTRVRIRAAAPESAFSMEQGGISDRLANFDDWGDRKRPRD